MAQQTATPIDEEEIRNALDSLAKNFQPATRTRFAPLIPYRNQIQTFRNQKASFRTIASLLKKFSVQTTGETVRRFYHLVIEQKPLKRRRQKANRRNSQSKSTGSQKSWRIGEPRIARIEDL